MYYIVNIETRQLIKQSSTPFNIDETVQPDYPLIQLKGVENNTEPSYDPATQKLKREFVDNDTLFTRTFYWNVVAKTAQEQAAYQQQLDAEATRQQIKSVYNALKDGQGTSAERIQRVEKAVAWLLRNYVQ